MPPLTGVAVKVTLAPSHTGFADAAIETLTGNKGSTVNVNVLDVPVAGTAQVEFDVRMHWIVLALAGLNVYVGIDEGTPMLFPLTTH